MVADSGTYLWPWGATSQIPLGNYLQSPQAVHFAGWACPLCLRCYAPTVTECPHCQPQEMLPDAATDCRPLLRSSTLPGWAPCPPSRDGGSCGCEDDDPPEPKVCLSRDCDC